MSKHRPRWQPPHPDPAKTHLERIAADTPVSQRRIDEAKRARKGARFVQCRWAGCPDFQDFRSLRMNIPLCGMHIRLVVDAHKADQQAVLEAAQEKRAQIVEKVEAGKKLDRLEIPPGWIYYVEIDGLVKIGYTSHVPSRMRAYPPTAKLLAVEPGTPKVERDRHHQFGAYLKRGREWFSDSEELRDWISKVRDEHGSADHLAHKWTGTRDVVGSKRMNRRW